MDSVCETYEPMDVDVSGHSVKAMDISEELLDDFHFDSQIKRLSDASGSASCRDKASPMNHEVKKYHILIQKPNRKVYDTYGFKILLGLIMLIISIIAYQVNTIYCSEELKLKDFNDVLSKNVFGQSLMINDLIESLGSSGKRKILFFYGGTGVGKTLVSSLLLDSVGAFSNVYHYTMPSFKNTFSSELMLGVAFCESSLIIVDDLSANDLDVKQQIKEIVLKSENLEKNITVIMIFNCLDSTKALYQKCDDSFPDALLRNFAEINAFKKIIQFKPLTVKELRKCIQQELIGKSLSEKQLDDLGKHFNVTVDGCKGVHSKMKYLTVT